MKVITIKQPYASLIANGYKQYEFRTWKTKYRGEIYIHAGLGVNKEAMKLYQHLNLDYPQGKILCKCNITDCIQINNSFREELKNNIIYDFLNNNIDYKGYAFKLENIELIKTIDAKGKLGLWNLDK